MNLNEHSVVCMRTLDIKGRFLDPNQIVNGRTNFCHLLDIVEEIRSKGIHEIYTPELDRELSFLLWEERPSVLESQLVWHNGSKALK